MKQVIQIRKATTQDFELFKVLNSEVQNLHATFEPLIFKQSISLSKEEYETMISNPSHSVHLGFEDNNPIGYIFCEIKSRVETPYTYAFSTLYIHHIAIKSSEQKKGFGKQFVDFAINLARASNISRIELDTWSFNKEALSFFRKSGFKTFNERQFLKV